ncbi:MAG: nucleotide exchange factor GrpE, partial [Planctomycetes bacterium]|nr:nucleotide exchange factor GrpE [Planctomycetota bacterium]
TVLDELQRGFTLNGQVIRPAKVKVSRRKSTA